VSAIHRRVVSDAPYPTTDEARLLKPSEVAPAHIRSFALRGAHMSPAQINAYEALYPVWGLDYQASALNYPQTFGRTAPVILEIGCGMGETTAHIAALMPEKNFLGVEVFSTGVGALLKLIDQQHITNLRLLQHDAVEVVRDMIAPESLDGVHIFFPDPWHKSRHNKRRLVQSAFISVLSKRLKPGGYLHCATDWENYAQQMLSVLSAEPTLQSSAPPGQFSERPDYRPATKFEQRGLKLGHGVWDLVFTKRGA
jgi:tRNA (guanine-N7-)-methyltransferase